MSEKNELTIVENIDSRLQSKRKEVVFPLSPTHRKELRHLRDKNIGNLNSRLNALKSMKKDEYVKKYADDIAKEFKKKEKIIEELNEDWDNLIENINALINVRKELEESFDLKNIIIESSYGNIGHLEEVKSTRHLSIDVENESIQVAREEFDKKYKDSFYEVQKMIDDISTKYEEAINFGDLEIVKELYYIMKNSDTFFKKISELEV